MTTKHELYLKIKDWFENGLYAEGIVLLEAINPKHAVLPLLYQAKESVEGDMYFDILKNRLELEFHNLASQAETHAEKAIGAIGLIKTEKEDKPTGLSGLKVVNSYAVNEADLPDELKVVFARTKELTPLIARLHADLANEELPAEKASELTTQLLILDDERAACWDTLDAWAEKHDEVIIEVDPIDEADLIDPVKRGIEIAKRIDRLKENIIRTYKAIDETERPNIKARNQVKLKAYEQELDELVKQVK